MMCSARSDAWYFYLCAFFFFFCYNCYNHTWAVGNNNKKRPVDMKALWIWSPSWWYSFFADNGLVNWDSLPLHSESPGYWGRVFSNYLVCHGEVMLMWFCELFREGGDGIFPASWWFSWPVTGVVGVVLDFVCYSIPLSHQLSLSLSPSFSHTLSLAHQFAPSNITEKHTLFERRLLLFDSPLSQ